MGVAVIYQLSPFDKELDNLAAMIEILSWRFYCLWEIFIKVLN